jgi:phosphoserine phosphatase
MLAGLPAVDVHSGRASGKMGETILHQEGTALAGIELRTVQWSWAELQQRIRDMKPQVAVFDCDGTLWDGDAGLGFMEWSLEKGIVSRSTADWIDTRHRAYRAGDVNEAQICGEMVQIYAGLREDEMRRVAAEYVREFVRPRMFAEMFKIVAQVRQDGAEIWAVSSTNKWVVCEGVRAFGIPEERVLAAEVAVNGGVIGSDIVDVPTDEGKVASLARVGITRPDAVFGNSIHDLAMLEIAANAFPINPSDGLLEAAARHGWGYCRPEAARGENGDITGA